ncbi:GNAT family N-acetyltransferase [Cryptosporangium sp. NPDC051539]|uniref:GNAT family N-acetyltransferase n=1 Tax=Cryptosporangium sp. NPDC051539 TaxID=3363962 RepID=UPI0037B92F79
MPPEYTIRPCTTDDVPAVGAVEADAFAGHDLYPNFVFRQAVDIQGDGFLVAEHVASGAVVGYVITTASQRDEDQWWIVSLGVMARHRRRGVGSHLTARAEAFGASKRAGGFLLTVDPGNIVALRLYHHLGYSEIARLSGHFGEDEDRLLLAYAAG